MRVLRHRPYKDHVLPLRFHTCRTVYQSQIRFDTIAVKVQTYYPLETGTIINICKISSQQTTDHYLEVCVVNMFKDQSRGSGLKKKKQMKTLHIHKN